MTKSQIQKLARFEKKYQNMWVALSTRSQKILAFNTDLKKLASSLRKLKEEYVLEKVLPPTKAFSPFTS